MYEVDPTRVFIVIKYFKIQMIFILILPTFAKSSVPDVTGSIVEENSK